jgi:hypothetical protein
MPVTKRLTIENVNLDDDAELYAFDDQVIRRVGTRPSRRG